MPFRRGDFPEVVQVFFSTSAVLIVTLHGHDEKLGNNKNETVVVRFLLVKKFRATIRSWKYDI
jgi:hypothetical protein